MNSSKKVIFIIAIIVVAIISGAVKTVAASEFMQMLKKKAVEFSAYDDVDYLIDQIGDQQLVLLGESTHGTSQYYTMRAEISKKLITQKGFAFVAVEGDWAALYRLNLYVKGLCCDDATGAGDIMQTFDRWPRWMWANRETAAFIDWLKQYNAGRPLEEMVGFYGIDVYGQWDAMERLLAYTEANLVEGHATIKSHANCFTRFGRDSWNYARAVQRGQAACDSQLNDIVNILEGNRETLQHKSAKDYFEARQNARVLISAEAFYRLAIAGGPASWNSRATHFYETVARLRSYYGENSRGVVWAHNTHVGDAKATPMDAAGMVNIGRLARADLGRDNVFIVGFATNTGKVLAGRSWEAPMEKMTVPVAVPASLEHQLSSLPHANFFIVFTQPHPQDSALMQPVGHRAIGVTYRPENERGNYVPTVLPERYDGLVFIRETDALGVLE